MHYLTLCIGYKSYTCGLVNIHQQVSEITRQSIPAYCYHLINFELVCYGEINVNCIEVFMQNAQFMVCYEHRDVDIIIIIISCVDLLPPH